MVSVAHIGSLVKHMRGLNAVYAVTVIVTFIFGKFERHP